MIARFIRRLVVMFGAWSLGHGTTAAELLTIIGKSYPHRDQAWRLDLLGEITDRAHSKEALR